MPNCRKLAKYLNKDSGEYDYHKVEQFLTGCCSLQKKSGGSGSHRIFYWYAGDQYDVNSQMTIPVYKGRKVKKFYVKKMWKVLAENLGILAEDFL